MKTTGVIRKLDELGRITLPIELRRSLDLDVKDGLEITVQDDCIILKKAESADIFTGSTEAIMLLFGLECCSILLWLVFICLDQHLLDWQITNLLLQAVSLDGFAGDERGLNMLAVLCGMIYPLIGIGCLFTGLRFINKLVTTKDSI